MEYQMLPFGDHGLCITWGNRLDEDINAQVLAVYAQLLQAKLPDIQDIIPAYSSISIVFDVSKLLSRGAAKPPFDFMRSEVEAILETTSPAAAVPGRLLEIPVCYDPVLAPDLETLALKKGISPAEVVQRHTSTEYRVYMLGFLPGFPYMGTVDARIEAPRLANPRQSVPAGSVGIAGRQTGIYPLESPGGWNLIGRTPLRIFDPQKTDPALFRPGDRVRFVAISLSEFHKNSSAP